MPTHSPSRIRAFAHRRMALSALHADSSLATRLARYNRHMARARAFEQAEGTQPCPDCVVST
ncbi:MULTISPECIES: hypothetical protein [Pseudomonas]|uniref:hypothetical protein n=1 Tax=Pseudomonas TaxID=286 RepID=UPI0009E7736E|nr:MULTISPECIES: hypothetical protein [Pseudomonas]